MEMIPFKVCVWHGDFRCYDGETVRIVGQDGEAYVDDRGRRWERTGDAWSCGGLAFRNVQPLDMLTGMIEID